MTLNTFYNLKKESRGKGYVMLEYEVMRHSVAHNATPFFDLSWATSVPWCRNTLHIDIKTYQGM